MKKMKGEQRREAATKASRAAAKARAKKATERKKATP
jgi:hypothetical protein